MFATYITIYILISWVLSFFTLRYLARKDLIPIEPDDGLFIMYISLLSPLGYSIFLAIWLLFLTVESPIDKFASKIEEEFSRLWRS